MNTDQQLDQYIAKQVSLADYLKANSQVKFQWGYSDCVLFASHWKRIATGQDMLDGMPPWKSKSGAARALTAYGGLYRAALHTLGQPKLTDFMDGDIAFVGAPYNCMGIVNGPYVVVMSEQDGLTQLDMNAVQAVWGLYV